MLRLEDGSEIVGASLKEDDLQEFFRGRRPLYETQARTADFGLDFRDTTCFDHETNDIVIGLKQLLDLGLITTQEFDFSVLHELKHYADLRTDSKEYAKLIAKGDRADGLGGIYFRLYNSTEDVAVNTRVAYDSPHYRGETELFSPMVHELYRNKLFQNRDFTGQLLADQFSSYILNLGMGVADDIKVSPEVRVLLDEPINIFGKKISLKEFVDLYLRPTPPGEKGLGDSVSDRVKAVDTYLLPRFEKLLEKDKQQNGEEGVKEASEGAAGEPAPGSSSIEDFKKAIKEIKKQEAEAKKTPSQRAKERQDDQVRKAGRDAGVTPEQGEEFLRVYNRVAHLINQLADLWGRVPQKSTETHSKTVGHFRSGFALDVRKAVREFPAIQEHPESVELMFRREDHEVVSYSPKRFRLRLVVDASGSMDSNMPLVGSLAVALTGSMLRVNAENNYRGRDFQCELDVWTYGSGARQILEQGDSLSLQDIMKAYPKFFEFEDSTNDHLALEKIHQALNPSDRASRADGELFDLLIEITDGETADPNRSKAAIRKIESEGVVCHAVKIGKGGTFEYIWNGDGVTRGHQVSNAADLGNVIEQMISDELARLAAIHQGAR